MSQKTTARRKQKRRRRRISLVVQYIIVAVIGIACGYFFGSIFGRHLENNEEVATDAEISVNENTSEVNENTSESGWGIDWTENPVDDFWNRYELSSESTSNIALGSYEWVRSDLWLAEVKNAYALMKDAVNKNDSEKGRLAREEMIDDTLEDFISYVEKGAELEGLALMTTVFSLDPSMEISGGTGLSVEIFERQANMYRAEALRMYSSLEDIYGWEEAESAFVFEEEELLATVNEEYGIMLQEKSSQKE